MNILYISGSPRKKSLTDYLLKYIRQQTTGEFIKLVDYTVLPSGVNHEDGTDDTARF